MRVPVLLGVQAFAVPGDAVFVHQGEAEAVFALGHDDAMERGECLGESADRLLDLNGSLHIVVLVFIFNGIGTA
ncbi:hypothetical protein D3C76_1387990 [compost metagenome]